MTANETIDLEYAPFFITAPGESDGLFLAVAIFLVLVVLGFGALYFTIQAIPDRLAGGASKVQLQLVGILGLLSLFTMNNVYWVAALLLAAVRIPDVVGPLRSIAEVIVGRRQTAAVEVAPAAAEELPPPSPKSPAPNTGSNETAAND